MDVSPDGDLVATVGLDEPPRVHVWDRRSGDQVFTVQHRDFYPERLAWSPDGGRLAVAGFQSGRRPGKVVVVTGLGNE